MLKPDFPIVKLIRDDPGYGDDGCLMAGRSPGKKPNNSADTEKKAALTKRLLALDQDAFSEEDVVSPASIKQLNEFFDAHPDLGLPKITMTPDGTLRARWIKDGDNYTAIEFLGNGTAKIVMETPPSDGIPIRHLTLLGSIRK